MRRNLECLDLSFAGNRTRSSRADSDIPLENRSGLPFPMAALQRPARDVAAAEWRTAFRSASPATDRAQAACTLQPKSFSIA